jgi:hypothetical protein
MQNRSNSGELSIPNQARMERAGLGEPGMETKDSQARGSARPVSLPHSNWYTDALFAHSLCGNSF